jgi:hypothetical protein
MAPKRAVTVSVQPTEQRPSSSERRAAQIAALATQQADLKREAAERRAKREASGRPPFGGSGPVRPTVPRRSSAR